MFFPFPFVLRLICLLVLQNPANSPHPALKTLHSRLKTICGQSDLLVIALNSFIWLFLVVLSPFFAYS
jgi:hypothetical protein